MQSRFGCLDSTAMPELSIQELWPRFCQKNRGHLSKKVSIAFEHQNLNGISVLNSGQGVYYVTKQVLKVF